MKKILLFTCIAVIFHCRANAQQQIATGADRIDIWLPYLKGKAVAVFANQTSVIGKTHLVDSLIKRGVKIVKIFGPEHGFRGKADAGEHVQDGIDTKTGLPVISLYGDHKKPTPSDLKDVDIVIFDIQDVGVRFYTFISSLEYVVEACIENHKPLLILDRPNPNGFYVDGPVLKPAFKSFVGMQQVPIVYGMTIGEYALMLTGEKWLSAKANEINSYNIKTRPTNDTPFHMQVIKCVNYTHKTLYTLPINPSPNLKEMQAIYWYPSTCFFEGTVLSEGRGTDHPFQYIGHPSLPKNLFAFTPMPNEGAKNSKCFNQVCYGVNITGTTNEVLQQVNHQIQLKYLISLYKQFPAKDSFFLPNNFFNKLAGNDVLMQQIKKGMPEAAIRKTWQKDLAKFKAIRKKYLLYQDFE
ncbi:exo-beta-N-acetylmuramidase NamZ domain-containing protein [Ferruginibacter yonginensis]|uniref:Exo-beta-N-acetylmuramidase NamZ domain-containing protein n=1 Tax=Ferruginibacter yonginensis TaxID=1310416 RepID=A0ABV8QV63_9BACT